MAPRNERRRRDPSRQDASRHQWVDTQTDLEALVADLLAADCVAVDTEFHRERSYRPQLALVQVSFDERIALVDPTTTDVSVLGAVLAADVLVVMHACAQDIEVLSQECDAIPSRLFDTQVAAGFLGMSTPSLSALTDRLLGVRLAKGNRLTDWFERPLRPAQQRYAADDVAYLIPLLDELRSRLTARDRWQWALDECEQWRRPPGPPPDPAQAGPASREHASCVDLSERSRTGWPPGGSELRASGTSPCASCCQTWRCCRLRSAGPAAPASSGACAAWTAASSAGRPVSGSSPR